VALSVRLRVLSIGFNTVSDVVATNNVQSWAGATKSHAECGWDGRAPGGYFIASKLGFPIVNQRIAGYSGRLQ